MTLDRTENITPHFRWAEFLRPEDVDPTPVIQGNIKRLAEALEPIRVENGDPIEIDSAYRTFAHQQELYDMLKGKQAVATPGCSQHEFGLAADCRGINAELEAHLWETWNGGMGRYPWGSHLDLGPRRRW
jgi:uncharacterized protein YcbK (DUF882 family)